MISDLQRTLKNECAIYAPPRFKAKSTEVNETLIEWQKLYVIMAECEKELDDLD